MKSATVLSTSIDSLKRTVIKVLRLGNSDVQTSKQLAPYGIDSNPVKDMIAIHAETGLRGDTIIVGYINKESITEAGETRLFSTDSDGVLKSTVYLKNDETLELMGNSNFAVKFNELQAEFNKLNSAFNSHVHASSGAPAVPQSSANITLSKNDKIKTN